jgi:hypothetical protein
MNVPGVTVRGFRLRPRTDGGDFFPIVANGRCAGCLLEQLDAQPSAGASVPGISLERVAVAKDEKPFVIQQCRIAGGGGKGIQLLGGSPDLRSASACQRIILRENTVEGGAQSLVLAGLIQQVHVVGNRLLGATQTGLIIMHLADGSEDLLIANNTFLECDTGLMLWDTAVKGKNVQFRNNLILTGTLQPENLEGEDAPHDRFFSQPDENRFGGWRGAALLVFLALTGVCYDTS